MLRTRIIKAPITEDFVTEFRDCKALNKLDLNHGYDQFCLDHESRKTTTFSTQWGNYWYKCLLFGGVNSQELFDAEISRIISGIPKVLNNRDDITMEVREAIDKFKGAYEVLIEKHKDYTCSVREVCFSVPYTKYLGLQSMYGSWLLKHGGFDSSVYYWCAIIQFHQFKYDVGTRHLATRIKFSPNRSSHGINRDRWLVQCETVWSARRSFVRRKALATMDEKFFLVRWQQGSHHPSGQRWQQGPEESFTSSLSWWRCPRNIRNVGRHRWDQGLRKSWQSLKWLLHPKTTFSEAWSNTMATSGKRLWLWWASWKSDMRSSCPALQITRISAETARKRKEVNPGALTFDGSKPWACSIAAGEYGKWKEWCECYGGPQGSLRIISQYISNY